MDLFLDRLVQGAKFAFKDVVKAAGLTDRTGGLFTAHNDIDPPTLVPILAAVICKVDNSQALRYLASACEKSMRLGEHPDHIGSSQSANEIQEKYGGSIRIRKWRITFSGLPDGKQDEAVVLIACLKSELITYEEAYTLAEELGCDEIYWAALNESR